MSYWIILRDNLLTSSVSYSMILGIFFSGFVTSFGYSTLRDGVSSIDIRTGSFSACFNSIAISKIVLFISWPACSNSTIVDGGLDKIDIISIAAYLR